MRVIANSDIYQTVGSLQVHRPAGTQFELVDHEAVNAIEAGHVRPVKTTVKPATPTHIAAIKPSVTR